mmetsp:Transcript_52599/g.125876  ORF Transcript_52599/g.125876 Transcript_52599/m.125876 type:complete len:278 (-) Transcript_52599:11-844(-)
MQPLHAAFQLPLHGVQGLSLKDLKLALGDAPHEALQLFHHHTQDAGLCREGLQLLLGLAQGIRDVLLQAILLLGEVGAHLGDLLVKDLLRLPQLERQGLLALQLLLQRPPQVLGLLRLHRQARAQAALPLPGIRAAGGEPRLRLPLGLLLRQPQRPQLLRGRLVPRLQLGGPLLQQLPALGRHVLGGLPRKGFGLRHAFGALGISHREPLHARVHAPHRLLQLPFRRLALLNLHSQAFPCLRELRGGALQPLQLLLLLRLRGPQRLDARRTVGAPPL